MIPDHRGRVRRGGDVRGRPTSAARPPTRPARAAGSDYIGKLLTTASLRITDKLNGPSEHRGRHRRRTPRWSCPSTCVATGDATIGGDCALNTTLDALTPGIVREGSRAIWELGQVAVKDAGPNGTGYGAGCPSTCGDGDEQTFMRQGVFVP